MTSINFSQLKPISDLPRNYHDFVKEVKEKGVLVFMRRSKPEVVLVNFELWQELETIKRNQDTLQAYQAIEQSEKEYKLGQAKKLKSLKDL